MDITAALAKGDGGEDGQHELIVRVYDPTDSAHIPLGKQRRNPPPKNIWYLGTEGIWQTVWMEAVRPLPSTLPLPDLYPPHTSASTSPAGAIAADGSLSGWSFDVCRHVRERCSMCAQVPDNFISRLDLIPNVDAQSLRVTVRGNEPALGLPVHVAAAMGGKLVSLDHLPRMLPVLSKGTGYLWILWMHNLSCRFCAAAAVHPPTSDCLLCSCSLPGSWQCQA